MDAPAVVGGRGVHRSRALVAAADGAATRERGGRLLVRHRGDRGRPPGPSLHPRRRHAGPPRHRADRARPSRRRRLGQRGRAGDPRAPGRARCPALPRSAPHPDGRRLADGRRRRPGPGHRRRPGLPLAGPAAVGVHRRGLLTPHGRAGSGLDRLGVGVPAAPRAGRAVGADRLRRARADRARGRRDRFLRRGDVQAGGVPPARSRCGAVRDDDVPGRRRPAMCAVVATRTGTGHRRLGGCPVPPRCAGAGRRPRSSAAAPGGGQPARRADAHYRAVRRPRAVAPRTTRSWSSGR